VRLGVKKRKISNGKFEMGGWRESFNLQRGLEAERMTTIYLGAGVVRGGEKPYDRGRSCTTREWWGGSSGKNQKKLE